MTLEPTRDQGDALADVIDAVLDKGLVINADIMVSLAGVELLGIKVRAALASFETAARYGLEFPAGTNFETEAWREAMLPKEACPGCGVRFVARAELLDTGCPACGWQGQREPALSAEVAGPIAAR
jgi:gas vesicle structural protein